jgi:toxin ParE1/3/4
MQVVIQPAAAADLEQAFSWYEERRTGLGEEFSAEVRNAIEQIEAHSESSPLVHREIRRLTLRRFPYGLFYRVYVK